MSLIHRVESYLLAGTALLVCACAGLPLDEIRGELPAAEKTRLMWAAERNDSTLMRLALETGVFLAHQMRKPLVLFAHGVSGVPGSASEHER